MELRPYTVLLSRMKQHFTDKQNAEMVAMIIAAEYQYKALYGICNSKMYQQLPSVASEAITTADEIAGRVMNNWGNDEELSSEQATTTEE